ncbi:MAG: Holliday junction branch migration protein RuvA [Lachnospiraceae bacterium]|nr:Holliday junction branch migration protein RuvA [Lachnospiraceae bacterium]MBQ2406934.1 Holliday junction branch migration protein RuvA [Lachnospiraceae bacterium]MEE0918515.1 Holliday junction branch migration protein RuvA [Lachnospiraceae bacterium]
MYAYIKGEIVDLSEDNVVIECNNIGYNIHVPASMIARLPGVGSTVKIYTYTSVKEDSFNLFGFLSKDELEMFKLLITVSGIGPKGALSIISEMGVNELRLAIISGDSKTISKAPGIGKKSAERIIIDLRNKVDIVSEQDNENVPIMNAFTNSDAKNDAIEALTSLGYSPTEALKAVRQLNITDEMDSGMILKQALKIIGM